MSEPPTAPALDADVPEAHLEVGETRWTVRVLGRAGRASGASPPLLLLGFWEDEAVEKPSLEALVAARSLRAMTPDRLQEAFSRASSPRDLDSKAPFFADAGQNRRGERRRS